MSYSYAQFLSSPLLALEVGDGMKAMAKLNPKSYRKALATIAELGAENVAVIVQGQMTRPGVIEGAGIVAQPNAVTSWTTELHEGLLQFIRCRDRNN